MRLEVMWMKADNMHFSFQIEILVNLVVQIDQVALVRFSFLLFMLLGSYIIIVSQNRLVEVENMLWTQFMFLDVLNQHVPDHRHLDYASRLVKINLGFFH